MRENHGEFVWYELMSKDPSSSEKFYNKVIGWNYGSYPMGEYDYRIIQTGENGVGGIMPLEGETPTHWISYITVPDVDAAVKKAEKLGGKGRVPPTDIPEVGRFAVITDPQGGVFSPFKPLKASPAPTGPGTVAWRELITSDPQSARNFYTELIGWDSDEMDMGSEKYVMFKSGEKSVGGLVTKPIPDHKETRPYWIPYINVVDVDAAVRTAEQNGGKVQVRPTEIPKIGRYAILDDPLGATFAVFKG